MFRKFASFVVKQRLLIIVLITVATAIFGVQIKNLKIVIDPNTMLPKNHPNVIGTNLAESLFGSRHVVVVGVSAANGQRIYQPEVLAAVQRLSDGLSAIPGVKRQTLMSLAAHKAKSITGDGDLTVERLYAGSTSPDAMKAVREKVLANPVYQGTLVSKDETVTSISFAVQGGKGGFRAIMDEVDKVMAKESASQVKLHASGMPVFLANVERFAQRMGFLFPIALILIGMIHFEAFRTGQGLILPLVTALLAVVWGLGIMGLAKVPMDAFNATTPILILAVAAGHAVQILKRYYEEYNRLSLLDTADSPRKLSDRAIVESLSKVAPVMVTAGLVAAIGFFSLITFDVATIRTFGLFTGLGILSALLIELTFIPALRSYLPPPQQAVIRPANQGPRVWDRLADSVSLLILKRRKTILGVFGLVVAVSSVLMLNVNRENSTKSYFGENLTVSKDDTFLNAKLAGTNTIYVVFKGAAKDQMKDPAVLRAVEDAQRYIETLDGVGKTLSIVDFLKQMNKSMNGGAAAYSLPDSSDLISQYLLLYSMSGDPTDFDAYLDYHYQNACLVIWTKSDSSKYAAKVVEAINAYVTPKLPAGVSIAIGGSVPQSSALSEVLVDGKIRNIAQMIFVVFLAGTVIFGSLTAGFYLIVPLLVTVVVNFGVMGLTGIPLNTPNSVSSAMAIGIGADYAIYILYRLREELVKTGDFKAALHETLRTAGKAVIYVATAIAGGYAVLMLSFNFYIHIWFGVLIVLSMVVSAISALILVPTLLTVVPPRFLKKTAAGGLATATAGLMGVAVLGAALVVPNDAYAQDVDVNDLMAKSYQATRVDNSISEATFKLVAASGQERVRKTFGATKLQANGIDNRRVIRFLSPSDVRNTSTLIVEHSGADDEIWVYLPALKKVRRLAANNKTSSFVGTDLTYSDLVGHKPQDWNHQLIRSEAYQGVPTYVVQSTPKTPKVTADSGYSKRVSWVAKDNLVALKSDFYDISGNLLKTAESSDVKLVEPKQKKYQAMLLRVKNHQTGHGTQIKLDKFETSDKVGDSYFSTRYLEKEE